MHYGLISRALSVATLSALMCTCLSVKAETTETLSRPETQKKITLVSMNDVHGAALPEKTTIQGQSIYIGGFDAVSAYLSAIRQENANTLFFLDGDLFQGTAISNMYQGQSIVPLYNALDVTAATMGNHELDYGQASFRKILEKTTFPWIFGNIQDKNHHNGLPFEDVGRITKNVLLERDGVSIGVVALTTLSTPMDAGPINAAGLEFGAFRESALQDIESLRKRGAEVIVLLVHDGGSCDMAKPASAGDEACQNTDPVTKLLNALPAGSIDAVIAGHTHAPQAHFIHGVPVIQNRDAGRTLGRIDLWFDTQLRKVVRAEPQKPIPLCHQEIEGLPTCDVRDVPEALVKLPAGATPARVVPPKYQGKEIVIGRQMSDILKPYLDKIKPILDKVAVDLPANLKNDRTQESYAANCVADISKQAFEAQTALPVDFAYTNSGKIRANFAKGPLRYEEIYTVMPFEFKATLVSMTGREINALAKNFNVIPKDISVVSEGWALALNAKFPRHVGFIKPNGALLAEDEKVNVLLLGDYPDVFSLVFERSRKEKEFVDRGLLVRDLIFDGLSSHTQSLPLSCRAEGALNRNQIQN